MAQNFVKRASFCESLAPAGASDLSPELILNENYMK